MKKFTKDTLVTIISIGDFMANTTKNTVKATGIESKGEPVFKHNKKGVRKMFTLRNLNSKDALVFEGEVPFKTDGEVTVKAGNGFTSTIIRGNACINLVGDASVIKDYIINKNLNDKFTALDAVIIIDGDKETPLFPSVPTNHAVMQRIRAGINN